MATTVIPTPGDLSNSKAADAAEPVVTEYKMEMSQGKRRYEARLVRSNSDQILTLVRDLTPHERAEAAIRADDGGSRVHREDLRWFLSRESLLRRADGAPHRMVGTKVDITARKRAEEAMRENEAVLQASRRKIQDLAGRLIAAQEVERARIARDLHDDLSQQVAGLSIALSGFKRRLGALPGAGDLQREASSLQDRTIALAEHIRHLSHNLHPSALEHAGLVAALGAYCTDLQRRQAMEVTFSAEGDFEATDAAAALCLYRVAQEALRNVVTHAGATHTEVRLRRTGDDAELTIADDGCGFNILQPGKSGKGLGLISITERVRLAGGTVSIVTELRKGTRVRVQVPVTRRRTSAAGGVSGPYGTSP